jgi:hypothetical protein
MLWIQANTRNWRVAILILLVLAIIGPWAFERLNVPAEYDCGPTNVRLEGDFCGTPISLIQTLFWMIYWFGNGIIGMIRGEDHFDLIASDLWSSLIYYLIILLLMLPIINLLFLIWREDRPRLQKFHLVVCGLNLVPILLLGLSTFPEINFAPWGLWLYLGVMIISLILEGILLKYQLTETPKTE